MKDRNLDNIDKLAKDAFDNFEVPFEPMDWAAFQHQLKAENSIDVVAKEALHDYEVDIPNNSWDEFEQLLGNQRYQQRYIWWLKAAEASAIVALLLCIVQWVPCSSDTDINIVRDQAGIRPNTTVVTASTSNVNTNAIASTTVDPSSEATTSAKSDDPIQSSTVYQPTTTTVTNATTSTTVANNTPDLEASSTTTNAYAMATATDEPATTTVEAATPATQEPSTPTTSGTNSNAISVTPNGDATNEATQNTSVLSTDKTVAQTTNNATTKAANQATTSNTTIQKNITPITLASLVDDFNTDPFTEIKKATIKAPFQPQHFIGGTLGVGANLGNSMGNTSIGYTAGLMYEHGISKHWSIRAGLNANLKRYDRNDVVQLQIGDGTQYTANQFKTTNLVVLEIPVDAQYNVLQNDKWRLYVAAGISLNAISSRIYSGTQELTVDGLAVSLNLNSDDFERGWMEGGTAQNNAFLSIGAGFGVERQLGNALSLYLLPTYRHAVTPTGSDYLHNFNVNIGIKSPIATKKK